MSLLSLLSQRCLGESRGGQPLCLCLSFAVIIFTRQLGHRPRCFDVTVSLMVLWAAAWSALIPTTAQRLKRVKQELDKAIVCSINGRTSLASLWMACTLVLQHTWHVFKTMSAVQYYKNWNLIRSTDFSSNCYQFSDSWFDLANIPQKQAVCSDGFNNDHTFFQYIKVNNNALRLLDMSLRDGERRRWGC